MVLFRYHLYQTEDVIQPSIEKFKARLPYEKGKLRTFYQKDLQRAEQKLKGDLDEKTKDFQLRKQSGIKLVLSLI